MNYKYNLRKDKFDERDFHFAHSISPIASVKLPPSVDLRYKCPPVYDQGELGSCTANAGCACRALLANNSRLMLSRLFLYYMERSLKGTVTEDSGASVRDICKAANKFGICEEMYMPYDVNNFSIQPSNDAINNAQVYKINSYRKLNTLDEIKQNIAFRQQGVLAGMDVYDSFQSEEVARTGRMTIPKSTEQNYGGHAVLIVGYIDTQNTLSKLKFMFKWSEAPQGYLIVRNSWGANWGEHGYFYMPYEFVTKGYAYDFWTMI
ncbi:C1 family peptidase [Clostridium sp. DJ247]|nr:C1 family peptidase [Clostridium sp. DJ247]